MDKSGGLTLLPKNQPKERKEVGAQREDPRSWLPEAMLRKVYKESGESFQTISKPCIFAQLTDPRQGCVESIMLIASAILHQQAKAIVAATSCNGQPSPCLALHVEFDSTSQRVRFQNPETSEQLGGAEDLSLCFDREVFVINASVAIHGTAEEIFSPPLVLGDAKSGTLLQAVMSSLRSVKLDITELSERFKVVVLTVGMDAASSNELLFAYLEPRLPQNVLPLRSPCLLHSANRIVVDHLTKSNFNLINPIYSMILLLQLGHNYEAFCEAALRFAEHAAWERGLEPDMELVRLHRRTLEFYLPNGFHKRPWKDMQQAVDFWNCDWLGPPTHRCRRDKHGEVCCPDAASFRANARKSAHILLLSCKPNRLCLSRWVKCVEGVGWFGLGLHVHKLFSRAWEAIAAPHLRDVEDQEALFGDVAADDEDPNEDRSQRCHTTKLSKGRGVAAGRARGVRLGSEG